MFNKNKKSNDMEKRSEEIIEETMQGIFDDLNNADDLKKVDEKNEQPESVEAEEKAAVQKNEKEQEEGSQIEEDNDAGVISAADGDYAPDDEVEDVDEIEEFDTQDEYDDVDYDEEEEESATQKKLKRHQKGKKAAIIAGSILGVLVLAYVGVGFFFQSHFLPYTKINGTDFSMKNVSQVEAYMKQQVSDYELSLKESGGGAETIKGADISLEYVSGSQLGKLVKKQNYFLWIESFWNHPEIKAEVGVKYDETALADAIGKLKCLDPEQQTASVDAHPEFQGSQFEIVPEVVGTQIVPEKFNEVVRTAISGFVSSVDLSEEKCYVAPRFVSDSKEVVAAKDAMNSYLGANITYDFNPNTEVVDASSISAWVKVDADMNVTFDEEAVRAYVQSLADKYNTWGATRSFTTANGNSVTVEGGNYGWSIDKDAEYDALVANIKNAETVTREPNYSSRGASHGDSDVGNTYAEVDLSNQQLYYIQNGQVVLQSGVVTGNPNKGNGTPQGTYSLAYKSLDQVLRGTKKPDGTYEYETPVRFWMPFNGGIGFHDATWQPSFGGSRYQTNGSHGCVNLPYDVASQLYDLISAGTPVILHY